MHAELTSARLSKRRRANRDQQGFLREALYIEIPTVNTVNTYEI
jgi:hypothetical protein